MQFQWAPLLWLLLLIPLLTAAYIWAQRRRKRFVLRYSSLMVVREAARRESKLKRHLPAVLLLFALTAMIVAAARPIAVVTLPSQQATVVLAMDVSGSMRTADMRPNRIEASKAAARAFVEQQAATTRIGLVAFSGTASLVQSPTTDHQVVLNAIDRLYLQRSTAIGSGLLVSLNALFGNLYADTFGGDIVPSKPETEVTPVPMGTHVPAIVVLLTDGANVQGPSPIDAAQKARDLGVRVYTIGVGAPRNSSGSSGPTQPQGGPGFRGGGPPQGGGFRTELDEDLLQQVAQITDGQYFRASDATALTEIYKNLNTEVIVSTERMEVSALVAGVAAASAMVSVLLALLWSQNLP